MLNPKFFSNLSKVFFGNSRINIVIWCQCHGGVILYVDDDAPLGGDGLTWETPYRFLHDAITHAAGGGISEIHVGHGIYKPDRNEANPDGTGDRAATFQMINNVTISGAYAGYGSSNPDSRDFVHGESVLSGDLLGNDGPDFLNNDENSFHVVTGSFTDNSAIIDGFTITAGNAHWPAVDEYGGGIFVNIGSPRILNCTIIKNDSDWGGSGIAIYEGSATLEDCKIIDCSANNDWTEGGPGGYIRCTFTGSETWLECTYGYPLVKDCVFEDIVNEAKSPIYLIWSAPEIVSCVFANNTVLGDGGAINIYLDARARITNCVFSNNHAYGNGGAIRIDYELGVSAINNCTFFFNFAEGEGNAIYNEDEFVSPILNNCEFFLNGFNQSQSPIVDGPKAQTTLNYSNITPPWEGAGTNNISAYPGFVDPANRDFRHLPGSPGIDAGDNLAVPEEIVTDMGGEPRFVDDPDTKDTGNGTPPIVDIGAYEFQVALCPWDLDNSGSVDTGDLLELFAQWGTAGPADFDESGSVDTADLLILFANWGPCP